MSQQSSLKAIAARIAGLRDAMSAVSQGSTPDHGKWSGVNAFARAYCSLANEYISLTGDRTVNTYDLSKLKEWANSPWPQQKGLFDTIFLDTQMLHNLLAKIEITPVGPLYNLLVSGLGDRWDGKPFQIELSRCVREYTNPDLTNRFGSFDRTSIEELKRAPSIFAYESGIKSPPQFGYIREVKLRQGQVYIQYELLSVDPFLTAEDLEEMTFELEIEKYELYRTHWAVKEVNLPKELHSRGIKLPNSVRNVANAVDVSTHTFDVALSFPGEIRPMVEAIVHELEKRLGPNTYFYDNNYVSQLARPSLDVLLQGIYRRATLDVVFISSDYQKKNWCGVEFRAIKEIIFSREDERIMYVRTDDGEVDGVFKTDGYVDARNFNPARIAELICERLNIVQRSRGNL